MVVGSFAAASGLAPKGPSSTQIEYSASFDLSSVEQTDDGWSTTSLSGQSVVVDGGEVTTRTVQLGACDHDHPSGFFGRLFAAAGPSTAVAGHSSGDLSPVLLELSRVESLVDLDRSTFGTVVGESESYCSGHWAVARPTDLSSTVSIWIEGSWSIEGGAETRFRIEGESAWGFESPLVDGEGNAVHVDSGSSVSVELVREIATMFDRVDFTIASSDDAGLVLHALTAGARWVVLEGETHLAD